MCHGHVCMYMFSENLPKCTHQIYLRILLTGRSRWPRGLRHTFAALTRWDCGFEYCRGAVCLSVVNGFVIMSRSV